MRQYSQVQSWVLSRVLSKAFDGVKKSFGFGSEKKAIAISDPQIVEILGGAPSTSGVSVTANNALRVPAVLQAVRLISETVGSLPCKLYREDKDGKEAAKDHPAYRLVHDRANPWTSAGKLRVDLTVDALMHGAGYARVVRVGEGEPAELHRIAPGTVQRRFKSDGEPFYLVQGPNNQWESLSYRDVLYLSAFGDVSPITLGKNAIGVAMVLERHASKFFAGGARPSGVLSSEKPIPPDEKGGATTTNNVLKSFRKWQDDASDAPLILDHGWNYAALTMPSTDAQFIENRLEQINEIARVFGVPPHMLYQLDRGTWGNTEQMGATFLQLCLRPWLNRWQEAYATVLLTEDEQDTHYFEFVIDDLQRADAAGRAEIFGKLVAMRAMTPNEVRAAMNLPPMEGGDELANPYTTTTTTGPAKAPFAANSNANPAKDVA